MREFIDEEDYYLEWEEFHSKHPEVDKLEYELGVKQTQEM